MGIFIGYPSGQWSSGQGCSGLNRGRRRTAVAVGVVWLLSAFYETGMQRRWFCIGECNIRIDLLVIYPALLIGVLAVAVSILRAPRAPRPPR